jgi:hypothetical protein
MANTYTLIASNTLSTSAASVTFSAIPNTYTDLVLRISSRTDAGTANDNIQITFNSDTATNYSITRLTGTGSAASSNRTSTIDYARLGWVDGNTATSNTFGNMEVYIPSYLVSANKPFSSFAVSEQNATAANMDAIAALWRNTAAITSLNIVSNNAGNFVSGSSFYLYGIKNS